MVRWPSWSVRLTGFHNSNDCDYTPGSRSCFRHALIDGSPIRPAMAEDFGTETLMFPLRQSERIGEGQTQVHVVQLLAHPLLVVRQEVDDQEPPAGNEDAPRLGEALGRRGKSRRSLATAPICSMCEDQGL